MSEPIDKFHWHEALDRCHVFTEAFAEHVADHPAARLIDASEKEPRLNDYGVQIRDHALGPVYVRKDGWRHPVGTCALPAPLHPN